MSNYPVKFDLPHTGLAWLDYYPTHKVFHPGYDLNAGYGNQDMGNPVSHTLNLGVVEYISPAPTTTNGKNGGFGWFVIVRNDNYGVYSRYAHLNNVSPSLAVGSIVNAGDSIGTVGNTGTVYAHLHWEIFGEEMAQIQKNHWRKWAFYPSNKSKSWVTSMYKDGIAFIDQVAVSEGSHWALPSLQYLKDTGIITQDKNPESMVSWGELAVTLERIMKK